MNAKPFLDTNILIYAFSADARAGIAQSLLEAGGVINVQVLNEFVSVARRKQQREWSVIESALDLVNTALGPPMPLSLHEHRRALEIAQTHGLHIYDALIVAAAVNAGCAVLYTEDMQSGQTIDGVTIRNPFTS